MYFIYLRLYIVCIHIRTCNCTYICMYIFIYIFETKEWFRYVYIYTSIYKYAYNLIDPLDLDDGLYNFLSPQLNSNGGPDPEVPGSTGSGISYHLYVDSLTYAFG
jgi:hypothetical protein